MSVAESIDTPAVTVHKQNPIQIGRLVPEWSARLDTEDLWVVLQEPHRFVGYDSAGTLPGDDYFQVRNIPFEKLYTPGQILGAVRIATGRFEKLADTAHYTPAGPPVI